MQREEFEIKEAALAMSIVVYRDSYEQIRYFANQGCIKPLCDLLVCSDPRTMMVCLEGLDKILEAGEIDRELGNTTNGVNAYAQMVYECYVLDKIESLQNHHNEEIYHKTLKILDRYWVDEDGQNLPFIELLTSKFSFEFSCQDSILNDLL